MAVCEKCWAEATSLSASDHRPVTEHYEHLRRENWCGHANTSKPMTDPLAGMTRDSAKAFVYRIEAVQHAAIEPCEEEGFYGCDECSVICESPEDIAKLLALAAKGAECVGAEERFCCPDCGLCGADEDGCCLTCGRDCGRALVLKEDK